MTGISIIKFFETCRLQAYLCPAGKPTIGWGRTKDVQLGQTITQEQADKFLEDDYKIFENAVKALVTVPLTEDKLGALTSFAYNVGVGAFKSSTMLRKLNAGDYDGAYNEFDRWVYGDGKKLEGLVRRRKVERTLFLG